MKLAVFDLDHTLLSFDCEWSWVNYIAQHEGIDPKEAFAPLKPMYVDYYERHRLDADAFSDFQMHFLARFPRARLDELLADFVREIIRPSISESAKKLVDSYRQRGDITAICSGTYSYVVDPIACLFGINAVLCGKPETDEKGEFTGRLVGLNSFGKNKVEFVRNFLQEKHLSAQTLCFYSDSLNDKPLFDYVESCGGECIAVNAEAALLTYAQTRGWKTLSLYEQQTGAGIASVREIFGI